MLIDQMNEKMLKALLETLPVELTVIDANDEVVGWNRHDNRLFKRPLTSMGVNFRYCHPESSLSKVIQIVEEMKAGRRDSSRFWIDMKTGPDGGKHKVLIEFFALRDDGGNYIGCLECTQDVEHIRKLEGEKRLLD
jgi:PAS domain S-box-containing protein